ncbi:hypothetical protein RvY_07437-2 [Ramazzottius varieornatus]|uniref:ABC-2 type transporter transmembrane domain-containing protein n=1 Tax=Ramazzottius varieornatus TaxID=947166 RepID=A0A1D1V2D5_RAMVA|nr:hypothetical protein RvY_07437-2 [Ramazzottius varieornatus]
MNFAAALTVSRVLSANQRHERVKRVVEDMGLNDPQLLNKEVSLLTTSEKRRLIIAMELVRDPLVVLIDEPTRDLDPLNSYLVISCLAKYAKKYDRILVITLEKPRSDIVALLDRVTILSLGDVVYTGYTKTMVDYFSRIGFPCPLLENPLMYYLCLATVDRRSKDRFTETNGHIEMLVQKYKFEGGPYKRYAPSADENGRMNPPVLSALAKPGSTSNLGALVGRKFTHLFGVFCNPLSSISWEIIFLRILAFPCLSFFIWLFYFRVNSRSQYSFATRNGLIFNALAIVSFLSAIQTTFSFSSFRTRYFQESRSGAYNGRVFILSEAIHSAFVNLITVFGGSAILFYGCGLRDRDDGLNFILFSFVLYCCWNFVELQTSCLMVCIKEPLEALSTTLFITIFYLVCASGTVKSICNLDDWLFFLTYGTIYRYAGSVINSNEFFVANVSAQDLVGRNGVPCGYLVDSQSHCRYLNSTDYLLQRYTRPSNPTFLYMDVCVIRYSQSSG